MKSDTFPFAITLGAVSMFFAKRKFNKDRMTMALRLMNKRIIGGVCSLALIFVLAGCNANAWMGDPTASGYYKPTPTTIPILDRIDIIEEPTVYPKVTKVTPADLTPSDLEYRIAPGDVLDVEIFGLYTQAQRHPVQRRVDQGGYFRVPEAGEVLVAGLTPQGAQDAITKALADKVMAHPSVQVSTLNQTGFTYTVYGGLARWGVFTLQDPDLRLVDVLALAGGVPQSTKRIHVIRQLPVSDSMLPSWNREQKPPSSSHLPKVDSQPNLTAPTPTTTPNIEDLINQLDTGGSDGSEIPDHIKTPEHEPTSEDSSQNLDDIDESIQHIDELIQQLDIGDTQEEPSAPSVSPGVLQAGDHAIIDIDDLVTPSHGQHQPVDVDELTNRATTGGTSDAAYIYVPESDSWISVSTNPTQRVTTKEDSSGKEKKVSPKVLERIIEIPWNLLRQGDSSYNIVIRPDDRVYVEPPPLGHLYIRGQITRPGVFNYPNTGEKMTLSEFITSAGDLGPIAVPEKVSLTRRIDDNMQATVTLNYAAILQRTEPDIFLKPNDHISIGTSWGATPMAIIRNGFRATYGFGFLLDRNFGNDVFGRPP